MKTVFKRLRRKLTYSDGFISLVATIAAFLIKLYIKTLRIETYYHPEYMKLDGQPVLFAFWHGRQFLLIPAFRDQQIVNIADISWAGELQTKLLQSFGYIIVRGSSKRKGANVLIGLRRELNKGHTCAFAVDGPRGPAFKSKPGIQYLANKTNTPIVPLATSAESAWLFSNIWDHFLLPKPFSRCYVAVGKPIEEAYVRDEEDTTALDKIMDDWNKQADQIMSGLVVQD
ncbi:MAG: lysophospholipid acyltransferase family protein [Gammaproteobacteria bacterium]